MSKCGVWGPVLALLSGCLAVACGPVVTVDGSSSTTSASGGEGGTTGSAGTTAQGGTTASGGDGGTTTGGGGTTTLGDCLDPQSDCLGNPGLCNTWACDAAMECVLSPVPDGLVFPQQFQIEGDCQSKACLSGQPTSLPDDSDVPDDANQCTADACTGGFPSHVPVPIGTPCGFGSGYCDGTGTCANCLDLQCPTGMVCDPATITCVWEDVCFDGIKDNSETDVDCGGPSCGKCADGQSCVDFHDCLSNHCVAALCVAGTCMDGILNNIELGETDIDCGGGTCDKCLSGKVCQINADCQSGNCSAGVCQ